ncbi:lysosomal thioesterase PPT2 homolog [Teleopsis dalmanni]|uniref:lysosomal thioesterase PPT2 homolog n=1 Tax=Teleopsis dalmanni TaxID=139649 RepID=UPI0018CE6B45|nr:lysosomal thioesterase PPT2 homolog [Teleopsis dalmanni]
MKFRTNYFLILAFYFLQINAAYKPVVILHGILSGAESMVILVREIEERHPGTKVYNCDKFSGWSSLESAWRQVEEVRDYIDTIGKIHPEGIIVLGYSQGGLLARAAIQSLPNHNVKTFISLSSPQAGQFGTSFLHLIFPDLVAKTAYELFYSKVGQHTSVGNYWNDPHKYDMYLEYSVFLPIINNEIKNSNSTDFKSALIRLDQMILIGGPNDGVITPWESSHFAYYNGSLDVIPLSQREIYTTDAIGLKTLKENDKLKIIVKPFVHHLTWHTNRHVIREVILPYLN